MAKDPIPAEPPPKRPRGRPPRPGGPIPQVEVQRAYRARLAAAGKVVRLVDANPAPTAATGPAAGAVPGYDPETHFICERQVFEEMRGKIHDLFVRNELLQEERKRLDTRNTNLEAELRRVERDHTATLKELIVLRMQKERPGLDNGCLNHEATGSKCEHVILLASRTRWPRAGWQIM